MMCQALWLRSRLSSQALTGVSSERELLPLLFLFVNRGPFSVFFNITHFYFSKGHWELVHESHKVIDNIFSPFLKGEHLKMFDRLVGQLQRLICISDMLQIWQLQDGI